MNFGKYLERVKVFEPSTVWLGSPERNLSCLRTQWHRSPPTITFVMGRHAPVARYASKLPSLFINGDN